jgi:hypothetical protein
VRALSWVVLAAVAALAACGKSDSCDDLHPCAASQTCQSGVCVAKGISPGDPCSATGNCGKGQLCVHEQGSGSICRALCAADHTCSAADETCVCSSDPLYQYCRPIKQFALTACLVDPTLGLTTGVCTTACVVATPGTPEEWCVCPSKMFGSKVTCSTSRGNASTYNPLCVPDVGDVSKWQTCSLDSDCQGEVAAP